MSFLNVATESAFVDLDDGTTAYYPHGFGCGRIISSEKRKKMVFQTHRRNIIIGMVLGLLTALSPLIFLQLGFTLLFANVVVIATVIPLAAIQVYLNHREVTDLPKTEVKLNYSKARAKSVRIAPLIFWKGLLFVGLCLMPFYVTMRTWFSDQLDDHEKTTKFAGSMLIVSFLATFQGWYGYQSYKIEEPTLKFRETHELKDINCKDEKEQIQELIIKEPFDSMDKLSSV